MQRSAMIKEIQLIFLTKQPPLGGKGYIFMSNCRTGKKKTRNLPPKNDQTPRLPKEQGMETHVPRSHNCRKKPCLEGKESKSHLCREIVRLSQGFLHQRSAGCPQHLFSLQKHLLILLLHLVAQVLSSSGKKRDDQRYVAYADAVVISLHLLHRAINTRKVCNDTQTHAQTRARNFRIINH